MGGISFGEILVILIVAILVYGKDLPQVARKAGAWYIKIKRYLNDVKDELARQIPLEEIKEDMKKAADELPDFDPMKEIGKHADEASKPVDEIAKEATQGEAAIPAPPQNGAAAPAQPTVAEKVDASDVPPIGT